MSVSYKNVDTNVNTSRDTFALHFRGMETFAERLARLVQESGISDAAVADCLGVSEAQAKRIKEGTTQSLKFLPALRLCRKMNVSPWDLAGEDPMPPTSVDASGAPAQTVSRLRELEAEVAQNTAEIRELVSDRKVALASIQDQIAELSERLSALEQRRRKAG